MIDSKLLQMIRCPFDQSELAIVDDDLLKKINDAIQRGTARDRADQKVTDPIESGLVTADGNWVYPIRNAIPTLIADQAIAVR